MPHNTEIRERFKNVYRTKDIIFAFLEEEVERAVRELAQAYSEYVDLLSKENQSLIGLNIAHGWQGDEESYKKGEELRAKIKALSPQEDITPSHPNEQ